MTEINRQTLKRLEQGHIVSPARPERTPQPIYTPDLLSNLSPFQSNQARQRFAQACPLKLPTPALCPYGGACHSCPLRVQAKMTVNQPGDVYEQEADRMAETVLRMPEPGVHEEVGLNANQGLQRQACPACEETAQRQPLPEEEKEEEEVLQRQAAEEEDREEEEPLMAREMHSQVPKVTPRLEAGIRALKGGGQPLPEAERAFFEPRFGYDFSRVRIHSDQRAGKAAQALNARAFTFGNDVFFSPGEYQPGTEYGKNLLGHELAHTIHQSSAGNGFNRLMRKPSKSQIIDKPSGYSYSTHCGWIDWFHSNPTGARGLIARVREASMRLKRKEEVLAAPPILVKEGKCRVGYEPKEKADSFNDTPIDYYKMTPLGIFEYYLGGFGVGSDQALKFFPSIAYIANIHTDLEKDGNLYTIEIAGFTDCVGKERYNHSLRWRRQQNIGDLFTSIGKEYTPQFYDINQYLVNNTSIIGRRLNRGVLIRFIPKVKPEQTTLETMISKKFGIVGSSVTSTIELPRSLTEEEILGVSLSIFMIESTAFESLQGWTDFITSSEFSEEDLPSNLISFYRAAKGYSREEIERICDCWDASRSLKVYENYNFVKNKTFYPIKYPPGGRWPAELDSIKPIPPKSSLWRFIEVILQAANVTKKCRFISNRVICS